jgi:uncharacterized protein YbjT (DUF2867 family)
MTKLLVLFKLWLLFAASAAFSSASPSTKRVAVVGATGRLGREVVQKLSDQGIPTNILLRGKLPSVPAPSFLTKECTKEDVTAYLAALPGVQVVQGDVTKKESLEELLTDCTACLAVFGATRKSKLSDLWDRDVENTDPSHAKQVNYQGVANLLEACKSSKKCKRIVRITGKGENPNSFFSVLINLLGSMAKAWNYQGELLLRGQQDVDYTIIRPGIMAEEADANAKLTLADDGADLPVSKIVYADIASLCIECLDYPNAARSTLTAMTTTTEEGDGESSWGPLLLSKVQPDRREFPQDMLEQHGAAVRKAIIGLGGFAMIFCATVVWTISGLF